MNDWFDEDKDREDEKLSRAICQAAIEKGLDPNDFGVTPEAEIVTPANPVTLNPRTPLSTMPTKRELQKALARMNRRQELVRQQAQRTEMFARPVLVFVASIGVGSVFSLPPLGMMLIFGVGYGLFCKDESA